MKQVLEQTKTQYIKGKTCHYCNSRYVVELIDYDHVFQRCEDCHSLVDPKCDSCGDSLKLTKDSYNCCEKCGGFDAMAARSCIRGSILYHQHNVEKTEQNIKKVEQKLKEVEQKLKEDKKTLKEDKKKSKESKQYYKGLLATAKKR